MLELINEISEINFKFNEQGLIPAIVQDYKTKDVLMLAYVSKESLKMSFDKGETVFFSRSRQQIWHKGETSGNTQEIKEIYYDCDQDTVLFMVDPAGPACHTGKNSCFYRKIAEKKALYDKKGENIENSILNEDNAENLNKREIVDYLYKLILTRKNEMPEDSYTTYLFEEGIDKILKKVGEESAEVIIAAKNLDAEELIYESADLLYHMLVLLAEKNVTPDEIKKELKKRHR